MNHLFNLVKKELRELLTPGTVASMVVMAMIFAGMGLMIGEQVNKATSDIAGMRFGYVNLDADDGVDTYSTANLGTLQTDGYGMVNLSGLDISSQEAIMKALDDNDLGFIIIIDANFSENISATTKGGMTVYYRQQGLSMFDSTPSMMASSVIGRLNTLISNEYLISHGLTQSEIDFSRLPTAVGSQSTYLNGKMYVGVTPEQITGAISKQQMFIPIIIMMVIVMLGSMLISSMGNEKENKTLETLLTMPVKRTTVVAGKIIGSALAGLLFAVIYMIGMYFYMNSMMVAAPSGVSLADVGLTLDAFDWVIVTVFVFLSIICALGLCMILGAFVKDYKAAQMYVMPISVLAIIPMMLTMFSDFQSMPAALQAVMFLIPFSHPMMVMNNLLMDQTLLIAGGMVYMVAFAAVTVFVTVKIYNSDILLTGWSKLDKLKKGIGKK